jgi:hypothetical protein
MVYKLSPLNKLNSIINPSPKRLNHSSLRFNYGGQDDRQVFSLQGIKFLLNFYFSRSLFDLTKKPSGLFEKQKVMQKKLIRQSHKCSNMEVGGVGGWSRGCGQSTDRNRNVE